VLEIENVTVGFGGTRVLAEVSLLARENRWMLVCGAAGSGKSTLMMTAAGVIPRLISAAPFSGAVNLSGKPLSALSNDDLFTRVGIVMQNVEDQMWDLGVEDLIAMALENRGRPKAEIRERIETIIRQFRIERLAGRRVLSLSGGERRMVAIAAALAAEPEVLVLDEPTTGLDPEARQRLVSILSGLRGKVPMLLVSEQDPASVADISDEVALLKGGALTAPVPLADIFEKAAPWLEAGILPPTRRAVPEVSAAEAGPEILAVRGLKTKLRRPDGTPVLADASLTIHGGETVALVGRNGAGKTTLFQSILGLAKIEAGSISIGGDYADEWTPARRARQIAYLPQNMRRILFNMTAREEVLFAITAGKPEGEGDAEKADAALASYGLTDLAEANPFALSSRQQAILGLACAEAAGSLLAILDEPLLARDLNGRRLLEQFRDRAVAEGRAILLITHDLELADDIAARALLLDGGVIAFEGATAELWTSEAYRKLGWPGPRAIVKGEVSDARP
jgi:energy-coupling factor transport system ATP-binding protein